MGLDCFKDRFVYDTKILGRFTRLVYQDVRWGHPLTPLTPLRTVATIPFSYIPVQCKLFVYMTRWVGV